MANHASAIKRHKQSENRRKRNAAVKSTLRTAIKKAKDAAASGKPEEAAASLKSAVKLLDKAVSKGVLHRNNASRKVSRLTLQASASKAK